MQEKPHNPSPLPRKTGHRKILYHLDLQPVLDAENHSLALDSQDHVRIPGIKDCLHVFNGYLCSGGVYIGSKLFTVQAIKSSSCERLI